MGSNKLQYLRFSMVAFHRVGESILIEVFTPMFRNILACLIKCIKLDHDLINLNRNAADVTEGSLSLTISRASVCSQVRRWILAQINLS